MTFFLLLMFGLLTKHLIVDFFLQGPYYYLNKGTMLHPGGLLHAGEHGIGTMIVLVFAAIFFPIHPIVIVLLGAVDSMLHYVIDYMKVNICRHNNWTATTSEYFWWMTGLDQYLHGLCYLLIIFTVAV